MGLHACCHELLVWKMWYQRRCPSRWRMALLLRCCCYWKVRLCVLSTSSEWSEGWDCTGITFLRSCLNTLGIHEQWAKKWNPDSFNLQSWAHVMLTIAGVAQFKIIYFLSPNLWLACMHMGSSDSDCMLGNEINCFKSGPVLKCSVPNSFCASGKGASCILFLECCGWVSCDLWYDWLHSLCSDVYAVGWTVQNLRFSWMGVEHLCLR